MFYKTEIFWNKKHWKFVCRLRQKYYQKKITQKYLRQQTKNKVKIFVSKGWNLYDVIGKVLSRKKYQKPECQTTYVFQIKSVAKNTFSIGRKFYEISHRYSSTLHYDVIKAMMTSHTWRHFLLADYSGSTSGSERSCRETYSSLTTIIYIYRIITLFNYVIVK